VPLISFSSSANPPPAKNIGFAVILREGAPSETSFRAVGSGWLRVSAFASDPQCNTDSSYYSVLQHH
jgi:hypothetical protein